MMAATLDRSRQKSSFAPIRISAGAFDDPRLRTAARLLRLSFEKLFVGLQKVWSWVTAQQNEALHPMTIAELLGRPRIADTLAAALCHPAVQLADLDDDGTLSLHLHELFGHIEWYANYRAHASAGGEARAAGAARNDDGTFARRDLEAEVLTALANGPGRRCDLRRLLACRKKALGNAVRALLESQQITETEGRYLVLAGTSAETASPVPSDPEGGSMVPLELVPRGFHGDRGTSTEPSAPAPAPAPAHAGEARAPAHARERLQPVAAEPAESRRDSSRPFIRLADPRAEALERVAEHYDELGQALEPDWRRGLTGHRARLIAEVWRPEDNIPEHAVKHALAMLGEEARERCKLGIPDPTRWYRAAWSPGVFQRALALPNPEAARQSAREDHAHHRRTHGPTQSALAREMDRICAAGE